MSLNVGDREFYPLGNQPLKHKGVKYKVAFKGIPTVPKVFKEEKRHVSELFSEIAEYLSPKENAVSEFLEHRLKKFGFITAKGKRGENPYGVVNVGKSFKKSFADAFLDGPKDLIERFKVFWGGQDAKEKFKAKQEQKKTCQNVLGLWMNIDKSKRDFDAAIRHKDLRAILEGGHKGKEEQLAEFFEKNKAKELYSYDDGKPKGLLADTKKMAEFSRAVLSKRFESLKELKQTFVKNRIGKKITDKQGSYIPPFGQAAAQTVARVMSGIIPAWFIANDFYNIRMSNSDNKKEAEQEWNSKFGQETARIGIYAYEGYVFSGIFDRLSNKSLPFAVGLNMVNATLSNIFSRILTHRPVLPVNVDEAVRLNALAMRKKQGDSSASTNITTSQANIFAVNSDTRNNLLAYQAFKAQHSDVSFSGKRSLVHYKVSWTDFKKSYDKVKGICAEDADEMLKLASKNMLGSDFKHKNANETLSKLKGASAKNDNNITIGKTDLHKFGKDLIDFFIYPFKLVYSIGKYFVNSGRKLFNKKPIKEKPRSYNPVLFFKNINKWADKAEKEAAEFSKNEGVDKNKAKRFIYASNKAGFLSTKVMDYGTDTLSNWAKIAGFVTVPFLAVDAYNVTLGETRNKDRSKDAMRQRTIQDSTRQGISYWFVKAYNEMFKAFSNASLVGQATVIGTQTVLYESLTRYLVGQPIFKSSHQKMKEIEEKREHSKGNWLIKTISSKVKIREKQAQHHEG